MKVLGWDDWLIFARDDVGNLVYTYVDIDPAWFDAPNGGLSEYGTPEWRVDKSWMLMHVTQNAHSYTWEIIKDDPNMSDEEFMERSRKNYLID